MMNRIGILGAGQLARMLALAGYPLGCEFVFYEPKAAPCAANLGRFIEGSYTDEAQLKAFAEQVDVITYETENIPLEAATYLAELKPVFPNPKALAITQDRFKEKTFCQHHGIASTPFIAFESKEQLADCDDDFFPMIIKTRTQGYDGKHQYRLNSRDELNHWQQPEHQDGWIAEKVVRFSREVSIIGARARSGDIVFYDICENGHDQGILRQTRNNIDDPLFEQAKTLATQLMNALNYVGVLAVECFEVDGKLLVNEMAPRVHNSGHWTIDAAKTSQFENHVRAIMGWSLGASDSIARAIMTNFIGEKPPIQSLLVHDDIHVHDYGKEARPGRKIGHMTKVIR